MFALVEKLFLNTISCREHRKQNHSQHPAQVGKAIISYHQFKNQVKLPVNTSKSHRLVFNILLVQLH